MEGPSGTVNDFLIAPVVLFGMGSFSIVIAVDGHCVRQRSGCHDHRIERRDAGVNDARLPCSQAKIPRRSRWFRADRFGDCRRNPGNVSQRSAKDQEDSQRWIPVVARMAAAGDCTKVCDAWLCFLQLCEALLSPPRRRCAACSPDAISLLGPGSCLSLVPMSRTNFAFCAQAPVRNAMSVRVEK